MAHHARKNELRALRDDLGIGHQDAARILAETDLDRRESLCQVLAEFIDITTYAQAVDFLDNPPVAYQTMCDRCGWTYGMVCPECAKGCGCEYECTGWRHEEMRAATGDYDDDPDRGIYCRECGAGSSSPYDECTCFEDDETEDNAA